MTKTHTHSSTDSEAFRDALEQLAAVARTAVSYVGYANDSTREREALSWIRKKHEGLLTSVLPRRTAAARPAMGLDDVADITILAAQPLATPVETDAPAWHGVQDAIDAWAQKTLGEDAVAIMSWSDRLAQHLAPALPRLSAETAIAALAKRFWSIHPSTLDDMGLTREEFYASEMVKLFGALTRNEPSNTGDAS